jgi:hypothetical protein
MTSVCDYRPCKQWDTRTHTTISICDISEEEVSCGRCGYYAAADMKRMAKQSGHSKSCDPSTRAKVSHELASMKVHRTGVKIVQEQDSEE